MADRSKSNDRLMLKAAAGGLAVVIPLTGLLGAGPSNALQRASTQTVSKPQQADPAQPKAKRAWIGKFRRGLGGFVHRGSKAEAAITPSDEAALTAPVAAAQPESGVVSAGAEFDASSDSTGTGIVRASGESIAQAAPQQSSDVMRELQKLYQQDGREMPSMNVQDAPNTNVPQEYQPQMPAGAQQPAGYGQQQAAPSQQSNYAQPAQYGNAAAPSYGQQQQPGLPQYAQSPPEETPAPRKKKPSLLGRLFGRDKREAQPLPQQNSPALGRAAQSQRPAAQQYQSRNQGANAQPGAQGIPQPNAPQYQAAQQPAYNAAPQQQPAQYHYAPATPQQTAQAVPAQFQPAQPQYAPAQVAPAQPMPQGMPMQHPLRVAAQPTAPAPTASQPGPLPAIRPAAPLTANGAAVPAQPRAVAREEQPRFELGNDGWETAQPQPAQAENIEEEVEFFPLDTPSPAQEPAPNVAETPSESPTETQAVETSTEPAATTETEVAKDEQPAGDGLGEMGDVFTEGSEAEADASGNPFTGLTLDEGLPGQATPEDLEHAFPERGAAHEPGTSVTEPAPSHAEASSEAFMPLPGAEAHAETDSAPASEPAETTATSEEVPFAASEEQPQEQSPAAIVHNQIPIDDAPAETQQKPTADAQQETTADAAAPEAIADEPAGKISIKSEEPAPSDVANTEGNPAAPPVAAASPPRPLPKTNAAPAKGVPHFGPMEIEDQPADANSINLANSTADENKAKYKLIAARRDRKGLKGFCPVALRDQRALLDATDAFTSEYDGRTYFFASAEAKATFDKSPDLYAPVFGGMDVLLMTNFDIEQEGTLDHAVWYRSRLYLFSSRKTMDAFVHEPAKYAVPQ